MKKILFVLLAAAIGLLLYNQILLKEKVNHKNVVLDELEDRVDRLEDQVERSLNE